MDSKPISGFSSLSKVEKQKVVSSSFTRGNEFISDLEAFNHPTPETQALMEQFSENTLGNFPLPYSIAPNFIVNGRFYLVPLVTEESSVVAAASYAARFWAERGGFHAIVRDSLKIGQIHFCWYGKKELLLNDIEKLKIFLVENCRHLTQRMEQRGGGIHEIELLDFSGQLEYYYQLRVSFETAESMGANFINSVLEEMVLLMKAYFSQKESKDQNFPLEIIMAILSNYTPDCIVETYVETDFKSLEKVAVGMSGKAFAEKFKKAVDIAAIDPYRAVTHNKGIFNGIDAAVIATANDFRAIEAAGHAYASRSGKYTTLSEAKISNGIFHFSLEVPISVGTVGGLTALHPIGKWSFEILKNPNAHELSMIIASAGLATNFSALKSLITSGIQKGHMKMHLVNILSSLCATEEEKTHAIEFFKDQTVSYFAVKQFLDKNNELK